VQPFGEGLVAAGDFAALLWDSDTDGPDAPVRVRGDRRVLWFGADGIGVELVVDRRSGRGRAVRGRLMPPGAAEIGLQHHRGDRRPIPADVVGAFGADDVAPGLVRLSVRRPGRRPLVCAWVNLD
jgi:hypothetical protein